MVIELYDDVNTDALTFGVKMALHDHPYFATRLVKEGVMYYWDENDAEPVIEEIPILSAFNYGHCADHYFPFKVTYSGNNICLIVLTSLLMAADSLYSSQLSWNIMPDTFMAI